MTTSAQMHITQSVPMDLDRKKKDPICKTAHCEFQIPKAKLKKPKIVHLGEDAGSEGSHSDDEPKKHHKESLDCTSKVEQKNLNFSKKIPKKKIDQCVELEAPLTEKDIPLQEDYLKGHPNDYICLTKLLELYKTFNMKKKLKEVRLYMLKIYPLSEGI